MLGVLVSLEEDVYDPEEQRILGDRLDRPGDGHRPLALVARGGRRNLRRDDLADAERRGTPRQPHLLPQHRAARQRPRAVLEKRRRTALHPLQLLQPRAGAGDRQRADRADDRRAALPGGARIRLAAVRRRGLHGLPDRDDDLHLHRLPVALAAGPQGRRTAGGALRRAARGQHPVLLRRPDLHLAETAGRVVHPARPALGGGTKTVPRRPLLLGRLHDAPGRPGRPAQRRAVHLLAGRATEVPLARTGSARRSSR